MRKNTRLFLITLAFICSTLFNLKAQTTIATGFNGSYYAAFKGSDLYIADFGADKIVKLDLSVSPATKTDFVTGLRKPNGIAILGNDLYVVESGVGKLVKINIRSKQQTTLITGLPIESSEGIAFKGNELYIAEENNISKLDITGTPPIAYTSATAVVTGLGKPYSLAFKGSDLYIADFGADKIVKKDITTTGTVATAVISGLLDPRGLVFDGNYLCFSEDESSGISRIDVTASAIVKKKLLSVSGVYNGLAIYGDTLYIVGDTKISKIPLPCPDKPIVTKAGNTLTAPTVTGATYQWLDCNNRNLPIPNATAKTYTSTVSGNYAVELTSSNSRGCKDTSSCIEIRIPVATGLSNPHFLVAKDGYIYTANFRGATHPVYKMDINTLPFTKTVFSSFNSGTGPVGVAIKDNDLYVGEYTLGKVVKIDFATGNQTDVVTGLNRPFGIVFKGNDLYISEYTRNKVVKVDVTGTLPITTTIDVATGLNGPNGIAFKGNDLYITEYRGKKVSKKDITTTGTVATDVATGLNGPNGLLVDGNDLYITEYDDGKISKIDVTGTLPIINNKVTFKSGLSGPIGMLVYGSYFYVAETNSNLVSRFPFTPCTPAKPMVTKSGAVLTGNTVTGSVYRWLNCGNNMPVLGATTNTFTATVSGDYSLEATRTNGCKDTSACIKVCFPDFSTDVRRIDCGKSYRWIDGNDYTITNSSAATYKLSNRLGCDSIVTLDLTVGPNLGVIKNGNELISTGVGATYRWLDCDNNNAIVATTKSYTPTSSGNYAVEVTKGSCVDTSICTNVVICTPLDASLTKSGDILTVTQTGVTYQWLDCGNSNKPIVGTTSRAYSPSKTGSYAVVITNSCQQVTSNCIAFKAGEVITKTTVAEGLSNSRHTLIGKGDELYILTGTYTNATLNKITKVNLTRNTLTTPVDVITQVTKLAPSMTLRGNELYFSDEKKIVKIDVTENPVTTKSELFTSPQNGDIKDLIFKEDTLYFISGGTEIFKADITKNSITTTQITSEFYADFVNLALKGNNLYLSDRFNDKIQVMDLATNTRKTLIDIASPWDLAFHGNDLYVIVYGATSKILKIDITATTPKAVEVITVSDYLTGLTVHNDVLYFIEKGSGKLSKIKLSVSNKAPTNLTASGIGVLGWTESGTATSWNIQWGPKGFTKGLGTFIKGLTTNSYTLTGLTHGTEYDFYVRANLGGGNFSAFAGPKTFTAGYCTPSAVGASSLDYGLDEMEVTNARQNFQVDDNVRSSYTDFYSMHAVVAYVGSTFNIRVGGLPRTDAADKVAFWVDWNNNLVFEASEKVLNATYSGARDVQASITIPLGTPPGDYRLRAVGSSGVNPDPCTFSGNVSEGKAIDCKLTVCSPTDLRVTLVGKTLTVNKTIGATYQWVDCSNNNMPIVGATSRFYIPTKVGRYAVTVTTDCDVVTSTCTRVCIPEFVTETKMVGCGKSYRWIDGNDYTTTNSAAATYKLTNRFGCDSIITLDLSVGRMRLSSTSSEVPTVSNKVNNTLGTSLNTVTIAESNAWLTSSIPQSFTDFLTFFGVDSKLAVAIANNPDNVSIKFYFKDRRKIWNTRTGTSEVFTLKSLTTTKVATIPLNNVAIYQYKILFDKAAKTITIKSSHGTRTNLTLYGSINSIGAVYGIELSGTVDFKKIVTKDVQHLCSGSYTWPADGNTYSASTNTPQKIFTNRFGCDSLVTLDLTIGNSFKIPSNISNIADPYTGRGAAHNTPGTGTTIGLPSSTGWLTSATPQPLKDFLTYFGVSPSYAAAIADNPDNVSIKFYFKDRRIVSPTKDADVINRIDSSAVVSLISLTSPTTLLTRLDQKVYHFAVTYDKAAKTIKVTSTHGEPNNPAQYGVNIYGSVYGIELSGTFDLRNAATDVQTSCGSYTWPVDGNTYSMSTNAPQKVLTNRFGCDSVVTLNLTVTRNLGVTKNVTTLTASQTRGTYRWLDCSDNTPVTNATAKSFSPTTSGSYAVELTNQNCVDTSICSTVTIHPKTTLATGLNSPYFLAIKGSDLYVTDDGDRKIIKIDLLTNTKSDFITAGLNNPIGLAINGNYLYVSELSGNKISRIALDSKAKIDTVKGLDEPFAIAFKGNELYIAENKGNRVSKKDITTAGTTAINVATGIYAPIGIAVKDNDLYVGEYSLGKVFQVDLATGGKTEFITGLAHPSGLFIDGDYLYIANSKDRVSRINLTVTPIVLTDVVTGLSDPYGMEVYADTLYIAEDSKISKIPLPCPDKPIVTKVGATLTATATGATYKWLDCSDNMPVANATAKSFSPIATGNYAVEVKWNNGRGCKDTSICTAVTVCVVDKPVVTKTGKVLSVDAVNGATYQWIDCSSNMPVVNAISSLFFPTVNGSYALELTKSNGCKDTSICTSVCVPSNPLVTKTGRVLSVDAVNGATYQWIDCSKNKPIANETIVSFTPEVSGSYAVEITGKNGCIDTSLCTTIPTFSLVKGFDAIYYLVANGSNLYLANYSDGEIYKIDLLTNIQTVFKTGLYSPNGITTKGNDLYTTDYDLNKVVKTDISSKASIDVVTGLSSPEGIVIKGNDLYISEYKGGKVSKKDITTTGTIATPVITGLNNPVGLAFKGNELYIAEEKGNKVSKIDITASPITKTEVISGIESPKGLLIDGDYLYISNSKDRVSRINLGARTIVLKDVVTGLSDPYGMEVYADTLYIVNTDKVSEIPLPCPDKPIVTITGSTFTASIVKGASYQWLGCGNNNNPISGATTNSYTASASATGGYAVEVTKGGCKDTSICVEVCVPNKPIVTKTATTLTVPTEKGVSYQWLDCDNNKPVYRGGNKASYIVRSTGKYAVEITRKNVGCVDTSLCTVVCVSDAVTEAKALCSGPYIWPIDGNSYSTSTIAKKTLTDRFGCDSVITLDLSIGNLLMLSSRTAESPTPYRTSVYASVGTDDSQVFLSKSSGWTTSSTPQNLTDFLTFFGLSASYATAITDNPENVNIKFYFKDRRIFLPTQTTLINRIDSSAVVPLTSLSVPLSHRISLTPTSYNFEVAYDKSTKKIRTSSTFGSYKNAYGSIYGIKLSGTVNLKNTVTDVQTSCGTYNWPANGNSYTMSTTVQKTLTNRFGCDSVVTLDLTITPNIGVTRNVNTLTASQAAGRYRWLDCNNNKAPILTSIDRSYTPTSNGNYAVEVTLNGCKDTSSCISVANCRSPDVSLTKTGTTLTATATGVTYQWVDCNDNDMPITTATAKSYSPTVSGNYAVKVTKNGCTAISRCTLVCISNEPKVTKIRTTLMIAPEIGATYRWLDCNDKNKPIAGAFKTSYASTSFGNYSVEVTNKNNCKDTSVCVAVCSPSAITKTGTTLTATETGASYQWLDCNKNTMPIVGETSKSFTPTVSGTYTVEVTKNGCTAISLCTVVCVSSNHPIVTRKGAVLSTNPVSRATYQWLDCDNANAPLGGASTSETYTAIASGNYAVEVIRSSGCKDTSLCTVVTVCTTNRPAVTVAGSTLSTNVVAGETYRWLDCGSSNASIMNETNATYTPTASGSYSVEITRAGGCLDTSICMVACVSYKPSVTRTGATLTAPTVAGATYQWLDCGSGNAPIMNETGETYTATVAGDYSVEITSNTCVDTSLCTAVTLCTPPSATVTKAGNTLTATETGATYQWLDCNNGNTQIMGETNATYTATASGSYSVVVTKNACVATSTCTTVCISNKPTVTVAGAVLSINAIQGATYQWLDCDNANAPLGGASTSESYTAIASGNYAVEVIRSSGCKDTSLCTVVTVCTMNRPAVTVAGAVLSINAIQGATYQWLDCDNANTPLGGASTSETYTATASGNYAVEVTRAGGCLDTSICMVACVSYKPSVTRTGATLTAAPTVAGATYQWLDCGSGNAPIMNETGKTYTATVAGDYSVEITSNTCVDTSLCTAVTLCTPPSATVTKSGNTLTATETGATYQWLDCNNGNTQIMGEINATYTPTASGSYSVVVTKNACVATSTCTTVCISNKPTVTVAGAVLSINAIQGATYQWLDCDNANAPLGGASISETYTVLKNGKYSVEILRSNGCKDTSLCMEATVNTPCVTDRPVVTVAGAVLSTNPVSRATYQWLDCDNNNAVIAGETSASYTATVNGRYSVEVTRANNCKDTSVCMEVKGVGLVENTFATDLKLYPNPTSDNVTIELGNNYSDMVVEITNILGQVVTRKSIPTVTNRKIVLPINASSGTYFVRIQAKEGFASFRIVKE